MATYAIGDRVRSTVELTSMPGFPPEDAIPAGSLGTVDYVHEKYREGYGVIFDCDRYRLSAWMNPEDLEAAPE
ncbi:hypothetical protein [Microbispora sp. NPDC049633]|uniref:hypothetical protein n=1 Tax=Microbispora sp. NPDC049633 TaxID=3154355 RepID=UPI0034480BF4